MRRWPRLLLVVFRVGPLVCCFGLGLLIGCAEKPPAPNTQQETTTASETGRPQESLRASGYAGADDAAEGSAKDASPSVTPDGAETGLLLFTDQRDTVVLVSRAGEVLRRFPVPGRTRLELAELLPTGDLAVLSVDEGVAVLGPGGRILWSADLAAHHDFEGLPDGSLLVCTHEEREWRGRRVRFDSLVQVSPSEQRLRWSSWDQREALLKLCPPSALDELTTSPVDGVFDRFHLNCIEVLPDTELGRRDSRFRAGNLLLCLRNADLLVILDADTLAPTWSWGPGELDFPHHPSLGTDGRLVVFDNGWHRGHSRVIELDPVAREVTWSWAAAPPRSFFTKTRGAVQRLGKGRLLLTESEKGRLLEVSRDGVVRWAMDNPLRAENGRRRIYRASRVPEGALRTNR